MAALRAVVYVAAAACVAASEGQGAAGELLELALPDVDFFMKAAQDPLEEFEGQAEQLKEQVAQQEKEKTAAIAKLKASFERNLTAQSRTCDWFLEESTKLSAAIATEANAIESLRQDSKKVQKSNDIMRNALESLRPKMRLAAKFLSESVQTTNDSNSTELEVLRPTTPEPSLEHFLGSMGEHGRKMSLLGLDAQAAAKAVTLSSARRGRTPEATPEELVGTLAQRLVDLDKAGDQGEAQLEARFLADYELGEKKKAELLAAKQALEQDYTEKERLHDQLLAVKKHLLEIRSELEERVKAVRLFAMKGNDVVTEARDRAVAALQAAAH